MPPTKDRSTLAGDDPRHGTANGYNNCGCRCDACRKAIAEYMRPRNNEYRHRTGRHKPREQYLAEIEAQHGTEARYRRCRCDECREAARDARRRRRQEAARV